MSCASPERPAADGASSGTTSALHAGVRDLVKGLERQLSDLVAPVQAEAADLRAENRRLRALLGVQPAAGPAAACDRPSPGAPLGAPPPPAAASAAPRATRAQSEQLARHSRCGERALQCSGDLGGADAVSPSGRKTLALPADAAPRAAAQRRVAGNSTEEIPTAVVVQVGGGPQYRSERTSSGELEGGSFPRTNLTVDLLPFWKDLNVDSPRHITSKRNVKTLTSRPTKGSLQHLDMHGTNPMARGRIFWEALGALCIIYDLIQVPLELAFHVPFGQLMMTMLYLHIVYWTLDLIFSFSVGYFVDGVLETRFAQTAKHYLKTWFFVDMCLVCNDWILVLFEWLANRQAVEQMLYLRVWRVFRLVRFVRLVRLLKLHNFFAKILEFVSSEYVLTLLKVSEHIMLIVIVNHFIACAWYWIGTVPDGVPTWTQKRFDSEDSLGYRYATSLHWSLTQFTPASMEVVPTNATERALNICVIILALVTFSTFISSITNAMTRLRQINGRRDEQNAVLRRYLGENKVSMQMAMRVWRYIRQGARGQRRRKMWCDVELFRELPELMQMELQQEVHMPIIIGHPFFFEYGEHNPAAMRAICHTAVKERALVAEQVLFDEGQAVSHVHFVTDGVLEYRPARAMGSFGPSTDLQVLSRGHWVGEAAVWVRWFYQGAAVAKGHSVVLEMSVQILHQVMKEYVDTLAFCSAYAELFVGIARAKAQEASDLTDGADSLDGIVQAALGKAMLDKEPRRAGSKQRRRRATAVRRLERHATSPEGRRSFTAGIRSGSLVSLSAVLRKSPSSESGKASGAGKPVET